MSKRYERMSKEEVVEVIKKAGGACSGCAVPKKFCSRASGDLGCAGIVYQWLNENIKSKMIHRYELIKADGDLDRIREEWYSKCGDTDDCSKCKYYARPHSTTVCFANYLKEEIEVEE